MYEQPNYLNSFSFILISCFLNDTKLIENLLDRKLEKNKRLGIIG